MMKIRSRKINFTIAGLLLSFLVSSSVFALDIVLEPATAQRDVGGKVRVHIYANDAVDLISMGVKLAFNPSVLQVTTASKYEIDADTGWVMDADGSSSTTDDQYRPTEVEIDNTNGTVTMLGGNINGTLTQGFEGKVLLGWIVFEAIALGDSDLVVDLAKYHPNHPTETFDNFVRLDGTVDEPGNLSGGPLGKICVFAEALVGDINGNNFIENGDYSILRSAMMKGFPDPAYNVRADFNANGFIENGDYAILRSNMMKAVIPCEIN